ncbi:hypothetical protein EVAR_56260_1 [Eumeta japonica]|uniref:Uncharacterized protein n=1 Tax=Eumeta variegata TaxID=151549 RepID=A0A4C1XIE8_EUMVA|nr:hypothetical protein EVAR_56260_1 [Eumeta japonica]
MQAPPHKPALRIFLRVASEYGFLRCVDKMMDSVSMFRLVYCSTSFTSGGQSTTATDAQILLQFIDGASACIYELQYGGAVAMHYLPEYGPFRQFCMQLICASQ